MTPNAVVAAAAAAPGAVVPVGPPRTFLVCKAPGKFFLHKDAVPGWKAAYFNAHTVTRGVIAAKAAGTWAAFVEATGLGTVWYGPAPATA